MNDTTVAAEAARIAAETEASREMIAQAAPDNPDPTTDDAGQRTVTPTPIPSPQGGGEHRDESAGATPLERITAADRSRADIAARFKEKRAAAGGQVEFHGDMRDPSQTYGPYAPGVQMTDDGRQRTEEEPRAQNPQATTEAPSAEPTSPSSVVRPPSSESRLVKVKVHGREAWLPEDEVIAEAQKSLAAGNLLESAKEVLSGARAQTTPAFAGAGSDRGQTTEHRGSDPSSVVRHLSSESDRYVELAQMLQLEDADSAGSKLKATIESETAKARQEAAREAARQVRIENELAASQRALQAFEKTHPDLASDEFARDSVTTQVQREINADLQAALSQGILTELPKSQDERNGLHTQLRAFGAPVRTISDIFGVAGQKYASWRGGTPAARPAPAAAQPAGQPPAASAPAAPRVELSPDRAQRRAQIVAQPTNGTVPPRAAALAPEQTMAQRRSAAVMAMRKARGQIVA